MTDVDGTLLGSARWSSNKTAHQQLAFTLTDAGRAAVKPGAVVVLHSRPSTTVAGASDWRVRL